MNERNHGLKVFLATVLSMLLFVSIALTAAVSFVGRLVDHETLQEVILQVDRSQLLQPGTHLRAAMEEYGLDEEFVDDALASDAVEDVLEIYVQDALNAMEDPNAKPTLNTRKLGQICQDNMDEITELIGALCVRQGEEVLTKSQVRVLVDEFLFYYGEDILEKLPEPARILREDSGTVPSVVRTVISICASNAVIWILVIICILLAAGIFWCRICKLKGLVWLGVVGILCGIVCALVGFASGVLLQFIGGSGTVYEIVRQLAALLRSHCLTTTLWLFVVSALMLAAYAWLHTREKRE